MIEDFPAVIDLTKFTNTNTDGFIIQGDDRDDRAGRSVSTAGDVNGDGFDDMIVGAHIGDDGGTNAGEAYVVFGKASGFSNIDLTNFTTSNTDGFIIQGDRAFDLAGQSVSTAGDVNGDGFDDMIVGARAGDDGGTTAGEAYVIFGKANSFSNIDLTDFATSNTDGFIIQGDSSGDAAGWSVSTAGDVNGDGFDDMIVGAINGDDGAANAGEAYVVFGKASGFSNINLTNFATSNADGFIIQGDAVGDSAGWSVSTAGDVNGDGFDDMIVGAINGDDGGTNAGEAYVIFGKAGGLSNIDLTDFATSNTDGFIIQGDQAFDSAGYSVSTAGDVNGDGFDDMIVGARGGNDGGADAGETYVIFGKAGGRSNIDLTDFTTSNVDGFIIQGDARNDLAGSSVSSAGDVNGDGFDDMIVGAIGGDDGATDAGEAYVIFGKTSGFSNIDLTDFAVSSTGGFIIQGDARNDLAGSSVSSAGDVNGDGFDDMIVGAIGGDNGGRDAGEAYVIFGRPDVAKNDIFATSDVTTITGNVFADNGGGPDVATDPPLMVTEVNGQVADVGNQITLPSGALLTVNANGDVTYIPMQEALPLGSTLTDRFTYTLQTGSGVMGTAFVTVTVSGLDNNDVLIGTPFGDVLNGGIGDDLIRGASGNDRLTGESGNDEIRGEGGNDVLFGGEGNDRLFAGSGDNRLFGGAGNDFLLGDMGLDRLLGEEGNDRILGGSGGEDFLSGGAGNDILVGNTLSNTIRGGDDDDIIRGFGGDDKLDGGAGNDTILADDGADFITAGDGDDRVLAFGGNDIIKSGAGNDHVLGGDGDDIIRGESGLNFLSAGEGDDRIFGGDMDDIMRGEDGEDLLRGGLGNDVARGGNDDDIISGGDGADRLLGDRGLDKIRGGDGDDVLNGGIGDDFLDGGEGNDRLVGGRDYDTLLGGDGDDALYGGDGNDRMRGGEGNDRLVGGVGYDTLVGDAGDDRMLGQDGNDFLSGGTGADYLSGGVGDDRILGGDDDDVLFGDRGFDTLIGARGNDTLTGGLGFDTFVFALAAGQDNITDFGASGDLDTVRFLRFGTAFDSFADVVAAADDTSGSTVIDFGGGDILTLDGVLIADLAASDFVFV